MSGPFSICISDIGVTVNSNLDPAGSREEGRPTTDNILSVSGSIDAQKPQTELHLSSGHILRIPTTLLLQRGEAGSSFDSLAGEEPANFEDRLVIPVIEEQLEVGKRTVVTGKVRLEKQVKEYQEELDVPLAVRTFEVERVVLNQLVAEPPPVRQEGDTTVYPVIEEQLVLTTQLVLKEEVRVTKRDTERRDNRVVTLRRESITVARSSAEEEPRR